VDVPVDDFVAESVVCPSCGTVQGLRGLRRAFDHAHAVADLAGPDPEGRFPDARVSIAADNPFKAFGMLQSFSEDRRDELITEDGVRRATVSIRVAPGHPLCDECHTPLRVMTEKGELTAVCDGCSARFRSCVSPKALRALGSVVGILSIAHREDRPEAALEHDDTGELRFRCPDCTTVLGDPQGRRVLTCGMCRRVCRVPAAHWHVRPGDAIPLQRAWVLFEGPSRMREELVRRARRRAEQTVRAIAASGSAAQRRRSVPSLVHVDVPSPEDTSRTPSPLQTVFEIPRRFASGLAPVREGGRRRVGVVVVVFATVVAVLALLVKFAR
jgi:hypothetical protein